MSYTGRHLYRAVTYVMREGFGIPEGFAVLAVRPCTIDELQKAAYVVHNTEWLGGIHNPSINSVRSSLDGPFTLHELKCWPEYFSALASGRKTFEWRRDDRGYSVGDLLWLREWHIE